MPAKTTTFRSAPKMKAKPRRNVIRVDILGVHVATFRNLHPSEDETLRVATNDYAFVLRSWKMRDSDEWLKGFRFNVWAEAIRAVYDVSVAQTAAVLALLNALHMEEDDFMLVAA